MFSQFKNPFNKSDGIVFVVSCISVWWIFVEHFYPFYRISRTQEAKTKYYHTERNLIIFCTEYLMQYIVIWFGSNAETLSLIIKYMYPRHVWCETIAVWLTDTTIENVLTKTAEEMPFDIVVLMFIMDSTNKMLIILVLFYYWKMHYYWSKKLR